MAERAGYDQPGDGYTNKHATIELDASPPYQLEISPPQQGYTQQLHRMQELDANNFNTIVVVNQPQSCTVINRQRQPDYIVPSILACICCFCPTGTCAVYYAYQAVNLENAGDSEGTRKMSDNAKTMTISSVMFGIIVIMFFVVHRVVYPDSSYQY